MLKAKEIDKQLRKVLAKTKSPMSKMLAYALQGSGKRLRPLLCLTVAAGYGKKKVAMDAAIAIELFHNFTLIHDDIEDGDETRRNKPTLWKKYGIPMAINAGDALNIMACEAAASNAAVAKILFAAFAEVIEGQHLDFELAEGKGTIETCMEMTEKKTGALFGAAAEAAGICTRQTKKECAKLRLFGRSLGTAFQLADDYRSIWSTKKETGKDAQSDIREHKRTLPFFLADDKRLEKLYAKKRPLTKGEISSALRIFNESGARQASLKAIERNVDRACDAIKKTKLRARERDILMGLARTLSTP
ncbi:polyprenyl synthetase family protein [Candidatus Kaiserbacteria bacterium]|nr:polyprenyl synthetase family protein [Candidatus Kaiserbacteria bacterium]